MSTESTMTYTHNIRIPYADVDQMGFVYYANYLVYFEMLRSEMLRQAGCPYPELEAEGCLLPVLEAHVDYKRPANYDDLIIVAATCTMLGPKLRIDYRVTRDTTLLATGHTVHVCMNPEGRAIRPAKRLVAALTAGSKSC